MMKVCSPVPVLAFKVTDRFLINAEYTWYDAGITVENVSNGADTDTDF